MAGLSGSTHRSDVVIIGGGVMGASTAYYLTKARVPDVVLLEAGEVASGSSGKPLGGVRAQFSDPANVALGLRSLEAFRHFESELGVDIGLQEVGYLFAIRHESDLAAFASSLALQNQMGAPGELVDPQRAVELCPYLETDDLLAAAWSPEAGFARPVAVVHGLVDAAAARGARVRTGTSVTAIETAADGGAVVRTADGDTYLASTVICTAGAWSGHLGAFVGVDLPIEPVRRQIAFSPPLHPAPAGVPFTIDYCTTAYFHESQDGGILAGWADPDQPIGFDRSATSDWHPRLRAALRQFAPALAELPFVRGWAGLYEITPDCNALIGEADPGFRFLYAAGFSGHGFLQGPAVGEAIADLYLGRTPAVDISSFDARRFLRPAVRTELGII